MMRKFDYKELDEEGWETLEAVSIADNFNQYMYDVVSSRLHGSVFEVGSGIGNISNYFISDNWNIFLSDIRENYCEVLRERFSNSKSVIGFDVVDLVADDFSCRYGSHSEAYDSIFALNVVEHIENDGLALSNCSKMLKKGGVAVVLVPAFQFLYNRFDKELYHFRRYDRKSLTKKMSEAGFDVEESFYFNSVGVVGWFVSGALLRRKTIPKGQMKLYNKIVPLVKLFDKIMKPWLGLSVVCVGKKR